MIIQEDKERTVKLLESEIEEIIEALNQEQHNIFVFMNYNKIIKKLRTK